MRTWGRRDFMRVSGAAMAAMALRTRRAGAADAPAGGLAGRRPNIVVILTDDQGYGDLGRNGNPVIRTPNLDRMYDEAAHFEDFHVSPTCSPTRTSLMTGRHEFMSGVTHTIYERERMSLKALPLPQVLKSAGYATGVFGKWHLGDEDEYQPGRRGFDEVFIHGAGGIGQSYPGTCGDAPGNRYFDPVIRHNGTFVKTSGYCTDVFFAQAMKWIAAQKPGTPFYAYITPNAPHGPLDCPPEYEQRYADKVKPNEAKFLGMVTNIDDNVGRLLARLKELGIEKDTLVVFMNDNGGTAGCGVFNAGMKGRKGSANNGGTRGMSLWRWPGVVRPGPRNLLAAHLDLLPTFAEIGGATVPPERAAKLEGFSLVPALEDPAAKGHEDRMLFTHVGRWEPGQEPMKYKPGWCSVRWRQYLMVRGPAGWTLFDLKADPEETNDLAAAQPDVVARLDKAYDAWWAAAVPCMENEKAYLTAPDVNPFKAAYEKQFGAMGPNQAAPAGSPETKRKRRGGAK